MFGFDGAKIAKSGRLAQRLTKKDTKHLPFVRKSVPLQADYYQKRISD